MAFGFGILDVIQHQLGGHGKAGRQPNAAVEGKTGIDIAVLEIVMERGERIRVAEIRDLSADDFNFREPQGNRTEIPVEPVGEKGLYARIVDSLMGVTGIVNACIMPLAVLLRSGRVIYPGGIP